MEPLTYVFDTQLLIEGTDLEPDDIRAHLEQTPKGDSLLVVGDEELVRIHFHTNEPWQVLEYAAGLGTVYDIIVENMQKQQEAFLG